MTSTPNNRFLESDEDATDREMREAHNAGQEGSTWEFNTPNTSSLLAGRINDSDYDDALRTQYRKGRNNR